MTNLETFTSMRNFDSELKPDSAESWSTKAMREVELLKAAGSGFAETAKKSLGEDKVETISKGTAAFALSAAIGRFAAAPGVVGAVGRVAGVGLGVPFLMDIGRNATQLLSAASDAWRSDANMAGNMDVAREHLGRFAFDSLLMTAVAVPGCKVGTTLASRKCRQFLADVNRPFNPGVNRRFSDEVVWHENGHGQLVEPEPIIAINRPQRTAFDLADKPVSMYPPAYKTLTADGASPWAKDVHWSLPEKQTDGTWLPGAWMEPKHSASAEVVARITSGNPKSPLGLYVSDSPKYWTSRVQSPGSVVYEVQIGDAHSLAAWRNHHHNDFIAQRVRLLRPVT